MSPSEMPSSDGVSMDADRSLLFGVLALQADIIDAERFAEVCSAWASKKGTPLADLLQQRDWITDEERHHVEFLLERKLRKHGGNSRQSLAATADNRIRGLMNASDDPEVRHSIAELPSNHEGPLTSTVAYQPETRSGLYADPDARSGRVGPGLDGRRQRFESSGGTQRTASRVRQRFDIGGPLSRRGQGHRPA